MLNLTRSAILTLPPDLNALDAVDRINQAKTGFALVADPCLVGIFTERNLFQAIATRVELAALTLADLMTRSPIALHESEAENLAVVLQQFQHHHLQYLPVVDDRGQPVSVIPHYAVFEALQNQVEHRQQTEAALQHSELTNRLLLDAIPNLLIRMTREGTYLDFLPAKDFRCIMPDSNMCGKTIFEVMPSTIADQRMCYVERALQTGTTQVYEYELQIEGELRHQEAQISVSRADEVLIVVRDITERKQISKALQESTERFREIAETVSQAFFVRSVSSGEYLYVSPAYEKIWGRNCTSLYQNPQSWLDDIHPDDRPIVFHTLDNQFQGTPATQQYRIVRPDGAIRWVRVNVSLVNDAAGNPLRLVGVIEDITERQQSEEKLNESQRFIESITDASPNLIYVYDLIEHRNIYTNYDIDRVLNYTTEDIQAMRSAFLPAIMHPEDFVSFGKHCQRLMAAPDREILEFDYRMRHKNGEWRWFHSRDVVFLRSADGQPKQILGAAMDITEQKQTEAELRESKRFIQSIMDASPNVLYLHDLLEHRNVYINQEVSQVLGYTPAEVQAMGSLVLQTLMHPEDFVGFGDHARRFMAAKDGEVLELEYRMRRKNGEWRWLCSQEIVFLRTPEGTPQQILGTAVDVTDRKQMEAALQDSEEKFRQLTSHIQDVFWIASPDDFSLYVSPAFEKVWEQSVAAVYHNLDTFFDSIHPDDRERVRDITSERNQQGGESDLEYRIVRPSGEIRWIHDRGFAIANESGQIYRVVGIASDITDRKQIEESLQQAKEAAEAANRAKSEFLSRMSHELRTPLTSVLGFADLIARDACLSPEHQAHLAIIRRSGTHLLNLINSVLEMSRIEAGGLTLNETSFDLHYLLEDIKDLFQLKATAKGLTLSVNWNPDLPQHIQTDENKLRQVLINLLDNAIKFTETGRVALRVSRRQKVEGAEGRGQKAEGKNQEGIYPHSPIHSSTHPPIYLGFQIEDTGAGIAPNELAVLFNAFTQTEAGRKLQQGTGLGLAISRQFVQMMAGEITVESQLAQGTTLTFTIQATLTEANAASSSAVRHQSVVGLATSATYRILIVDDQAETRRILARLLEPIGFEVQEAANGREAVALWQSWQPHLIWMDMRMPITDGYTATREIRARERARIKEENGNMNEDLIHPSSLPLERFANIPHSSTPPSRIIALTANAFDQQRSSAFAAGCDDFVVKPFRHTDILQKTAEHLAVEYRYAEDQPLAKTVETTASPADSFTQPSLSDSLPSTLPAPWSADLRDAALRLHSHQCLKLIEQLPETHRLLAQMLTDRVNCFQFDAIVDWVEQIGDR